RQWLTLFVFPGHERQRKFSFLRCQHSLLPGPERTQPGMVQPIFPGVSCRKC
ncbi:hypothetical protein ECOK1180_0004, partial [Escherichia coli OK1180]